uniref:Shisa N-terminal domain-containing protein n=1 Tax=Aquila chrysaetos chrysaetos TaxID=223781 RepID=A0A663EFE7_AQUCH
SPEERRPARDPAASSPAPPGSAARCAPFECNNSLTGFRYCCGTCFYRFCCNKRAEKLNQSLCRNYKSPEWAHPTTASGALPADGSNGADGDANKYDPDKDSTNATVYISCGAIAFVLIAGVFGHPLFKGFPFAPPVQGFPLCTACPRVSPLHRLSKGFPFAPPVQGFSCCTTHPRGPPFNPPSKGFPFVQPVQEFPHCMTPPRIPPLNWLSEGSPFAPLSEGSPAALPVQGVSL